MPTIIRLNQCRITMYFQDHLPPHFHILANDGREALVEIATLSVMQGQVSRQAQAEALAWATQHQQLLEDTWNQMNP